MKKILVAGATGYLGSHIIKAIANRKEYEVYALVRENNKSLEKKDYIKNIICGEVTKPETIEGMCEGMDIIISTIGITKQKDGLTYEDVDYKGNLNLLNEAQRSNVSKFVYVSVFNADSMKDLKVIQAKLKFVESLKQSNLDHLIVNPNGFYSDMKEFYNMARKGKVYLFGDGTQKMNPIHGKDLAEIIVNNLETPRNEIDVGGPEVFTHNQMAELAYHTINKKPKIKHIPFWMKDTVLWLLRIFTSIKTYGSLEFLMTVLSKDMVAPTHGRIKLSDYYQELKLKNTK